MKLRRYNQPFSPHLFVLKKGLSSHNFKIVGKKCTISRAFNMKKEINKLI